MAIPRTVPRGAVTAQPQPGPPGRPWLAWLVALLGLVGLAATLRPPGPPPPAGPPVRYLAGTPLVDRLVIVFAPQLDATGVAALGETIRPEPAGDVATFTLPRPQYTPFPETTVLLLAGNAPEATPTAPPVAPAGLPSDSLVRALSDQGREVRLVGPPNWQALFTSDDKPPGRATPVATVLAEAGHTLQQPAALILVYLADVTPRGVGGELRDELASLRAALGARDALLIVGGGGGLGTPLAASLSGPPAGKPLPRLVAFNDIAPTCAVLLGAPYPYEARGRIAWSLLAVDERVRATASASLARQRTTLAARAVPFGVPYPALLQTAIGRLQTVEAVLAEGQYAYSYQLASSSVSEADRSLQLLATGAVYVPPRRVAWPLVAVGLASAGIALMLTLRARAGATLGAAALGFLLGAGLWTGLNAALGDVLAPSVSAVTAVLTAPALLGGGVGFWLSHWRRATRLLVRSRFHRTVELLVLLSALPVALCAYRYGYPWRLRLEEPEPLFRWRSALLAPPMALVAGYAWAIVPLALFNLRLAVRRHRVRTATSTGEGATMTEPPRPDQPGGA